MKSIFFYAQCLLVILYGKEVKSQSILDKISRAEKAVFSISSHGNTDSKTITASGFFISSDGIAIAPANIFSRGDSITLTLRNGREYSVSRILSIHKMANLAIFKVQDIRHKGFHYLIPSQNIENNSSEVLIINNPDETENGISLGTISDIYQVPYLDRIVIIDAHYGKKSVGSPVLSSNGQLIGIASYLNNNKKKYFLNTYILNDTLWINHPYNYKTTALSEKYNNALSPYICDGILNFALSDWINAAKNFTLAINNDSSFIEAFIFRGESRRQYENFIGMKSDYNYAKEKSPNHFLTQYFEAKNFLKNKETNKAFSRYIDCINSHHNFSPALVEFGLLVVTLKNDSETALKCFSKAIHTTPLFADAYYQRSRLNQQYSNNDKQAMEDITKAIHLNRMLPGSYSIRGTLKIKHTDYFEAINDFDNALNINPNDTHALFNRRVAYYNLGMKEKSCKDWQVAGLLGHFKSIKYISRYCNNVIPK